MIDQISRDYDGFYFGRFDLRAESVEEFKLGRNFKLIALNGCASDATFEIGDLNRTRGARPSSVRRLLREMVNYQVNQST